MRSFCIGGLLISLLFTLSVSAQDNQTTYARCGLPDKAVRLARYGIPIAKASAADCASSFTNPAASYAVGIVYEISVVVHIIQHSDGRGAMTDAQVQSQIDILNEDYQALPGTLGAQGQTVGIRFVLAGITRTTNDTWFDDGGNYWDTLAQDPQHYLNIYTNSGGGSLGYVPFLPADGPAGTAEDRVVIDWQYFGRNSVGGAPYNQGRTTTHEVGHYLGLEHPFAPENGSCPIGTAPSCYSNGDYICDTPPQSSANYDCPSNDSSCGSGFSPVNNYMDYMNDTCMTTFSTEQVRRMRCSLVGYRSQLYRVTQIFQDDFEN